MTTAKKSRMILRLGAGTMILMLNACQVWSPPPPVPPRNGTSLDNPPAGGSRYLEGPMVTDPNNPGAPIDPSQIQPPQPTGGSNDGTNPAPPSTDPTTPPPPTTPEPAPAPRPPTPTQNKAELPYGLKVPGKPGFVYSPYDKSAGIVDVTGFAPGTKVKCPYTNKVFLVP